MNWSPNQIKLVVKTKIKVKSNAPIYRLSPTIKRQELWYKLLVETYCIKQSICDIWENLFCCFKLPFILSLVTPFLLNSRLPNPREYTITTSGHSCPIVRLPLYCFLSITTSLTRKIQIVNHLFYIIYSFYIICMGYKLVEAEIVYSYHTFF
jgi:hypothetical protein